MTGWPQTVIGIFWCLQNASALPHELETNNAQKPNSILATKELPEKGRIHPAFAPEPPCLRLPERLRIPDKP
jgi:hypothetical protein